MGEAGEDGKSKLESAATATVARVLASLASRPEALSTSSKVPGGAAASKSSVTVSVSRLPGATMGPGSPSAMALPGPGGSESVAIGAPFHSTCIRFT